MLDPVDVSVTNPFGRMCRSAQIGLPIRTSVSLSGCVSSIALGGTTIFACVPDSTITISPFSNVSYTIPLVEPVVFQPV